MLPLIPLGIGVVTGLPIGWKIGRYFFGENVEANLTNIQEKWETQLKVLEFSLLEPFFDKKVYAYYIYGLISSHQDLLLKLIDELNSNAYIEHYKNTFVEWESLIINLKKETLNTLNRYLIYESLFKQIFNIEYDEKNFFIISEKIKPLDMLTEKELNQLILWIINPLFNGWYDFEMTKIPVIKCRFEEVNGKLSWIDEFKSKGLLKPEYKCETLVVQKFIPPLSKKVNGHLEGPFDCVTPWILYNAIITKKITSKEMMDRWTGVLDKSMSLMTGINAGYVAKGGKVVDDLTDSAADFYANMKKEFRALKNSLSYAYQGTTEGVSSFTTALTYGGLALGGYLLYDLFTSDSRNQ